jgi:divalent metal cation (Fe/Co/Zn/Cd) transporter
MTHSEHITQIDTVRAYHSGPVFPSIQSTFTPLHTNDWEIQRIIVEVDIVMSPSSSLRTTHDVAEELQIKIESLPDVERAYVHVDYETSHKPEHFLKKEL